MERARAAAQSRPDSLLRSVGWILLYLRGRGVLENAETITSMCLPDVRPQFAPDAKPINILCIDGGGIRGRNLMVMVEELEKALGRPLAGEFDLVAGSSIGGCGALFLQRYGAKATTMARQAMSQLQERCFAQRSKARLLSLGHYCQDARREFMLELCGREPLRNPSAPQRGPRAFALSSRMGGDGSLEPFLFRSYMRAPNSMPGTSRADLSRAVEATSAAPLMFPRTRLRNGQHLTDGGLIANDPTAIALQEAAALWPNRPVGLVLSLGTGELRGKRGAKEELRLAALQAAIGARGGGARGNGAYVRLQPQLDEGVSMIETEEPKLLRMEEATRAYFHQSQTASELVERLRRQAALRRPRAVTARPHYSRWDDAHNRRPLPLRAGEAQQQGPALAAA